MNRQHRLSSNGNAMLTRKKVILGLLSAALMTATLAGPTQATDDEDVTPLQGRSPTTKLHQRYPGSVASGCT